MKFPKVKALLATAALITVISSQTVTAASLQFQNTPSKEYTVQTDLFAKNVSKIVDTVNLKDKSAVEALQKNISSSASKYSKETDAGEFQKASIVRVADGDTIVVNIDNDNDGKEEQAKVRLIGVNTPESVASEEYLKKMGKQNTAAGKTASQFTKSYLSNFDYVYLEKDKSDTDKYGRLLRYVWVDVPDDEYDIAEISTDMLNGVLVSEGYAEVATYKPDVKHEKDFEQIHENYLDEMDDMEK